MDMESIHAWLMSLSEQYQVNPYIFASIYVGAIPFFTASLGWLIKNMKQKKSITLPLLSTGFFFCSAYLYLMIVGENVPWWVYGIIGIMILYGAWSTYQKLQQNLDTDGPRHS
jgi:ABC-type Co2+ transport system permease subunit